MGSEIAPVSDSIIKIKIGNKEYPVVRSSRCGTCMHPARFAIEERLLLNYGYPSIIKWMSGKSTRLTDGTEEEWPVLTKEQLKYHRDQGHCPADSDMIHDLAQRRAQSMGFDLEENRGRFVDHVVAQQSVLAIGVEALLKGEIQPDVKDLLAASKLLADLEAAKNSDSSVEQWQELMVIYFKTVQATVSPEQWRLIMGKIANNPTVKSMQEKRVLEGEPKND
jgi:hypothetical protein